MLSQLGNWCPKSLASTEVGVDSHHGFIIQAKVDLGRTKYMPKYCDLPKGLGPWAYFPSGDLLG
jgi:hypothetical protein